MEKSQIQSVLVLLSSLESQIQAIRGILGISTKPYLSHDLRQPQDTGYTTDAEDDEIEKAMGINYDEKKDQLLQDMLEQARQETDS